MKNRTKKDLWIEMSIREIWTQSHFAELAYKNISPKAVGGTDLVFSSIHSFLSHCANASKMLKAKDDEESPTISIGSILGVPNSSPIHNRRFRNYIEHYDRELKRWINQFPKEINIGTYNLGPKSAIQIPNFVFVRHYDPTNNTFTFVNEDIDLSGLFEEVKRIKNLVDSWLGKITSKY